MRTGQPLKLTGTGVFKWTVTQNDAIPSNPQWLKYDRQVLKFDGYFQEAVVEDPNENYRIRKCVIYYYLEDDTLHILEPKVENSGIPQGVFLKRHKVKNPNTGNDYNWREI
jgi:hypothetical protein